MESAPPSIVPCWSRFLGWIYIKGWIDYIQVVIRHQIYDIVCFISNVFKRNPRYMIHVIWVYRFILEVTNSKTFWNKNGDSRLWFYLGNDDPYRLWRAKIVTDTFVTLSWRNLLTYNQLTMVWLFRWYDLKWYTRRKILGVIIAMTL